MSVHVLCPMIRQLRELQSQQPTECKVTVTSTGDIVVQSHKFAYGLWSSLLSVLKVHCDSVCSEIFSHLDWMAFTDLNGCPINVIQDDCGWFNYSIESNGTQLNGNDLTINDLSPKEKVPVHRPT